MRLLLRALPFLMSVLASGPSLADTKAVDAETRIISQFKIGSDETIFGSLEFVGGLEISAQGRQIGAMSGIRFLDDRLSFLGVSDTGFWFQGQLERNELDQPSGIASFAIAPIQDQNGRDLVAKGASDAEAVTIKGDMAFVSFERRARIDGYMLEDPLNSKAVATLDVQIPQFEFRSNGGLEALATSPAVNAANAVLSGSILAFAERSVDDRGHLFAAIVDGPDKGVFFVKRDPPYNITDADFLPNGDLILLERRFSIARGVGMRLRHIKGDMINVGATVDGEILLDAGAGYQIDNMEGLDVSQDDQGQVYLTLISDDNHSFLQRNLMLEFKLLQ